MLLTHITRNNETDRQEQLRTVLDMFLKLQKPAILLGDLNTTGDDPQIRRVLAMPGVGDPLGQILGPQGCRRGSTGSLPRGFSVSRRRRLRQRWHWLASAWTASSPGSPFSVGRIRCLELDQSPEFAALPRPEEGHRVQ